MKRFIVGFVFLLAMVFGASSAVAQESMRKTPKPEYLQQMETPNAIGVDVAIWADNPLFVMAFGPGPDYDPYDISGVVPYVGVRYMRTLTPTISVGVVLHYTGELGCADRQSPMQSINYYSLSAECRFTYLRRDIVKLYGSLGFGVTYINALNPCHNSVALNFNVSPFGIRIGHKVGGYIELGVGYHGIIAAGVDVRF